MKESSVDRIFAKSPEEEDEVKGAFKKRLESGGKMLFSEEKTKTPEEAEIIDFLDKETSAMSEKFGAGEMHIPQKNIRIIEKNDYISVVRKKRGENAKIPQASWNNRAQAIFMMDTGNDLAEFTNALTHEMYHSKAFQSFRSDLDNKVLDERRGGLAMVLRGESGDAFVDLDEAVTEFLVYKTMDGWAKEKGRVPDIINEITEKTGQEDMYSPVYFKEQIRFAEIMNKIQKQNPEEYKTTGEVADVFIKAYFTGHLLKLRKLIDDAYGKGSFVEFAEKGMPPSAFDKNKEKGNNK